MEEKTYNYIKKGTNLDILRKILLILLYRDQMKTFFIHSFFFFFFAATAAAAGSDGCRGRWLSGATTKAAGDDADEEWPPFTSRPSLRLNRCCCHCLHPLSGGGRLQWLVVIKRPANTCLDDDGDAHSRAQPTGAERE